MIPVVVLSVVACLKANPAVCETVFPNAVHRDGTPIGFGECLGAGGQDATLQWLAEHPGYVLGRVRCSVTSDPARTRREQQDTPA